MAYDDPLGLAKREALRFTRALELPVPADAGESVSRPGLGAASFRAEPVTEGGSIPSTATTPRLRCRR